MISKFSMFENLEPGAAPGSRLPHWRLSGGRQWQGVHTPSHALCWPCPARSCLVPAGPWGRRWENGCGCSRCIYWGLGEFCPETLSSRGWGVLHCSSKPNTPDIVPGSPDTRYLPHCCSSDSTPASITTSGQCWVRQDRKEAPSLYNETILNLFWCNLQPWNKYSILTNISTFTCRSFISLPKTACGNMPQCLV